MTHRHTRVAASVLLLVLVGACGKSTPAPTGAPSPTVSVKGFGQSTASAQSPGDAALRAGREFTSVFFSPDYRTIDDYSQRVDAGSTGAFRADFDSKVGQLRSMLAQVESVAQGRTRASAVREVTPSSATVLVAADQDVHNKTTAGKTVTNRYRVVEQLRLVDGRWFVDDLQPVVDSASGVDCADPGAGAERAELLKQSCDDVARLYSYDYRHLDADLAAQRDLTTGVLRNQIVQDTSPALRDLAPKTRATVQAVVVAAATEHLDGDRATVLLFLNQAVSSTKLAAPRLDRNRVEATVQRVDGRWLVADLKAL